MDTARTKLSITLDPDVVKEIDRAVENQVARSRSAVIEKWLRRASRLDAEARLREATIAYYESFSKAAAADNTALSKASPDSRWLPKDLTGAAICDGQRSTSDARCWSSLKRLRALVEPALPARVPGVLGGEAVELDGLSWSAERRVCIGGNLETVRVAILAPASVPSAGETHHAERHAWVERHQQPD